MCIQLVYGLCQGQFATVSDVLQSIVCLMHSLNA